jgi:hypothetical protein
MRFRHLAISAVLVVALVLISAPSNATIITMFDNFDVGDSYNGAGGVNAHWVVDYLSLGLGDSDQDVAMAFTAAGAGYSIVTIELALGLNSGANELDISVHEDAGGLPGTVLETWHLTGAIPAFGGVNPPVAVNSSTLSLTAGTQYWVSISATGPNESTISWHDNTVGYVGLQAGRHQYWGNTAPWISNNLGLSTMRIKGITRTVETSASSWGSVKSLYE